MNPFGDSSSGEDAPSPKHARGRRASTNPFDDSNSDSDSDSAKARKEIPSTSQNRTSSATFTIGSDESISGRERRMRRAVSDALRGDETFSPPPVNTSKKSTKTKDKKADKKAFKTNDKKKKKKITPTAETGNDSSKNSTTNTTAKSQTPNKKQDFPYLLDLLRVVDEISDSRVAARDRLTREPASIPVGTGSDKSDFQTSLERFVYNIDDDNHNNNGAKRDNPMSILNHLNTLPELQQAAQIASQIDTRVSSLTSDVHENYANAKDQMRMRLTEGYLKGCDDLLMRLKNVEGRYAKILDNPTTRRTTQTDGGLKKNGSIYDIADRAKTLGRIDEANQILNLWWKMEDLTRLISLDNGIKHRAKRDILECKGLNGIGDVVVEGGKEIVDLIFRDKEKQLEAAVALSYLRRISKSGAHSDGGGDKQFGEGDHSSTTAVHSTNRFIKTGITVQLVSDALEERLLRDFYERYALGGIYDFVDVGAEDDADSDGGEHKIDVRGLRSVANALDFFDNGRNLHKRYVQQVLAGRFSDLGTIFEDSKTTPEMRERRASTNPFEDDSEDSDEGVEGPEETEIRHSNRIDDNNKLSEKFTTLFDHIGSVCSAEFGLISRVFSNDKRSGSRRNNSTGVAKMLIDRVLADPTCAVQTKIDEFLSFNLSRGMKRQELKSLLCTMVQINASISKLFKLLTSSIRKNFDGGKSKRGKAKCNNLVSYLNSMEQNLYLNLRGEYTALELSYLESECRFLIESVNGSKMVPIFGREMDEGRGGEIVVMEVESLEKLVGGVLNEGRCWGEIISLGKMAISRAVEIFGGSDGIDNGSAMPVDWKNTGMSVGNIWGQLAVFMSRGVLVPILDGSMQLIGASKGDIAKKINAMKRVVAEEKNRESGSLDTYGDLMFCDLGVSGEFWNVVRETQVIAKKIDSELWEDTINTLNRAGFPTIATVAKERRLNFTLDVENQGENALLRAIEIIVYHVDCLLDTSSSGGGGTHQTSVSTPTNKTPKKSKINTPIMTMFESNDGGIYNIDQSSLVETSASEVVLNVVSCLEAQYENLSATLRSQSVDVFWDMLMNEIFGVFLDRLLKKMKVTMFGAVVLSRDVECLQNLCVIGGSDGGEAKQKFDLLREVIVLFMVPPESLKVVIIGDGTDDNNSLFSKLDKSKLVSFLQRRADWKSSNKLRGLAPFASDLLLGIQSDFRDREKVEADVEDENSNTFNMVRDTVGNFASAPFTSRKESGSSSGAGYFNKAFHTPNAFTPIKMNMRSSEFGSFFSAKKGGKRDKIKNFFA